MEKSTRDPTRIIAVDVFARPRECGNDLHQSSSSPSSGGRFRTFSYSGISIQFNGREIKALFLSLPLPLPLSLIIPPVRTYAGVQQIWR